MGQKWAIKNAGPFGVKLGVKLPGGRQQTAGD